MSSSSSNRLILHCFILFLLFTCNSFLIFTIRLPLLSSSSSSSSSPSTPPLNLFSSSHEFSSRADTFFSPPPPNPPCTPRFFMTSISITTTTLGPRETMAIQTLFHSHPHACLLIVSSSSSSSSSLLPFLRSGYRVASLHPDYHHLFNNTPALPWFLSLQKLHSKQKKKKKKKKIKRWEGSLPRNLSNLLRLALLYAYGGVYVDTDVIILRSFTGLRNSIGAQAVERRSGEWSRLNNAVMVFDKGHPLLLACIKEFVVGFDWRRWGHNGPYLVSRVAHRMRMRRRDGFLNNFTVMPPSAFYPVDWTRIGALFRGGGVEEEWRRKKIEDIRNHSFALHLWNRWSRHLLVEDGSVISTLLADFCIFCNSSSLLAN